ncbi:PorP/SprF family type IX secretion system membrane protein [Marinigracilibium pacificum]|uniref:PorP/SprF family type IX secretion system membrane protein n=1 Tax=Marinigracilibium pacificum TaxID=2729599 RepID=A0A848J1B6_9BACT|nr:PorP/SprF family type IX secretion system membrane protein [Marinigracilibium pacificum]NMM49606.1 PorP/SprF family type IX secretion system membrane protein [Marinigracilibium pacificum]
MLNYLGNIFVSVVFCITLVFLSGKVSMCIAQNGPFTQYLNNEFILNPAYAGADDALSLTAIYRSQWSNIEGMPVTQTLSGHSLIKNNNSGVGATITHDQIGIHRNITAVGAYSYRINLSNDRYLALGFQAGIKNIQSNYTQLSQYAQNPLDPKIANADFNYTRFDLGLGLLYTSEKFKLGISLPSYNTSKDKESDSLTYNFDESKYFLLTSYKIEMSSSLNIYPGILINYTAGLPITYDVNIQGELREVLTIGFSYRHQTSLNFLLQAVILPQLRIGYAYDYPSGKNALFDKESNELMLNYIFKHKKSKVINPR